MSATTCTPTHQCGTPSLPFCSIGQGVRATTDGEVWVARGTYTEALLLRDGVRVRGGFDATFTQPPDTNPETNATTISTTGTAIAWAAGARAGVDGVNVVVVKTPPGATTPETRHVIEIPSSATATLRNLRVISDARASRASTEVAVAVRHDPLAAPGSVTIQTSELQAAPAYEQSTALDIEAGARCPVSVSQSTVAGGAAGTSIGLVHDGDGTVSVSGGTVRGGVSAHACGIRADGASTTRAIDLDGVIVLGNRSPDARGISMTGGARLRVHGGQVIAKGPLGRVHVSQVPLIAGLHADSVALVDLDGVTVAGTDGSAGGEFFSDEPAMACGVLLANSLHVPGVRATIQRSNIEGGTFGLRRVGIATDGVPLALATSDVGGNRYAVDFRVDHQTERAAALDVTGSFAPGDRIEVRNNPRIVGGDVSTHCAYEPCGSYGISITGDVDSVVEDNGVIRGANVDSGSAGDGIYIRNGRAHMIRRNAEVAAGRLHRMGPTAGINVAGLRSARPTITVEDNQLIAGNLAIASNLDNAIQILMPTGFYGQNVIATIQRNTEIVGGYGTYPRGIWIERADSLETSDITIVDNHIRGGSGSASALLVERARGSILRNVVQGCGLTDAAGGADQACSTTEVITGATGLNVGADFGTLIANNYVFASVAACVLGESYFSGGQSPMTFVHNACIASGLAGGAPPRPGADSVALRIGSSSFGRTTIANNILDAEGTAILRTANAGEDPGAQAYDLVANDLVPRGRPCIAGWMTGSACYRSVTELNLADNPTQHVSRNVARDPGYVGSGQDATSKHLNSSCALSNLGTNVSAVPLDFDLALRSVLAPTIGPHECR